MTQSTNTTPAIAMIGCGAIAENFHLPALARVPSVRDRVILVDRDSARTAAMAKKFGMSRTATDYQQVLGEVQGAILAVPAKLHFPIAQACMGAGVHVLCEKPLTETATETDILIAQAASQKVALAVNNTRRLFPSSRRLHAMLSAGELGAIKEISFIQGEKFDWPCASNTYFGAAAKGRGVLADTGAHVVDLVCWWLGSKPLLTGYSDDSFGGTEAVADLTAIAGSARVHIRLSWLSKLENVYRVTTERGVVEGTIYDTQSFTITDARGKRETIQAARGAGGNAELATALIDNFVEVLQGTAQPLVSGADVAPSIQLIDECYARRQRFDLPWHDTFARYANV